MALVVEDGSIVAGANSYASLVTVRAFATTRGLVLPATDPELEPKVHLAMDWLEAHDFLGTRVDIAQALSFPRYGISLDGIAVPFDSIPQQLVDALCLATYYATKFDLEPEVAPTSTGALKRKKLDVIEREYFEPSFSATQPYMPKLESLISGLVSAGLGVGRLTVYRT